MTMTIIVDYLTSHKAEADLFIDLFWSSETFKQDVSSSKPLKTLLSVADKAGAALFIDGFTVSVLANYALAIAEKEALSKGSMFDLVSNINRLFELSAPFLVTDSVLTTFVNYLQHTTYLRKRPLAKLLDLPYSRALAVLTLLSTMHILSPNTQGYRKTPICNAYLSLIDTQDFTNFLRFYK